MHFLLSFSIFIFGIAISVTCIPIVIIETCFPYNSIKYTAFDRCTSLFKALDTNLHFFYGILFKSSNN